MDQYQYDESSKLSMSSVSNEHSQRMDPRGRRRRRRRGGGGGGGGEEEGEEEEEGRRRRGRGGGGGGEILQSIIHVYTYHSIQASR